MAGLPYLVRSLLSTTDAKIWAGVRALKAAHAGTGYLPEFFPTDDASQHSPAC